MSTKNLNPELQIRTYNDFAIIPYLSIFKTKRAITLRKITFFEILLF